LKKKLSVSARARAMAVVGMIEDRPDLSVNHDAYLDQAMEACMAHEVPDDFAQLERDYPEIAAALSGAVVGVLDVSGLDEKTKQLVYVAVQTAVCYPLALKYHVPLALKAGASPREVIGAAAVASAAAGPKSFVTCYPTIREEIEKAERSE